MAVADARSGGIDLSASLPHQVYPHDALAPATVRSLSRQSMVVNGDIGLDVAVLSASGEAIYRASRPLMQREIPRTGPGRKPRLRLVEVPTVYADLEPVVPVTGPLLYVSQVWSKGHWLTFRGGRLWFTAEASWLEQYRGGSRQWEWYALAGWLSHPVISIDYALP